MIAAPDGSRPRPKNRLRHSESQAITCHLSRLVIVLEDKHGWRGIPALIEAQHGQDAPNQGADVTGGLPATENPAALNQHTTFGGGESGVENFRSAVPGRTVNNVALERPACFGVVGRTH